MTIVEDQFENDLASTFHRAGCGRGGNIFPRDNHNNSGTGVNIYLALTTTAIVSRVVLRGLSGGRSIGLRFGLREATNQLIIYELCMSMNTNY